MKQIIAVFLAALLLLSGCGAADSHTATPSETAGMPTATTAPEETTDPTFVSIPTLPENSIPAPGLSGDSLAFSNPGKTRLTYKGNVTDVRYITSVEQLPEVEALAGYDAEYFENHALLIVVETCTSGSLQVELEEIRVSGDTAVVSLKRTMPGDVGTADMATWLLWAEVEKGLDYTWCIKDRPREPVGEKY